MPHEGRSRLGAVDPDGGGVHVLDDAVGMDHDPVRRALDDELEALRALPGGFLGGAALRHVPKDAHEEGATRLVGHQTSRDLHRRPAAVAMQHVGLEGTTLRLAYPPPGRTSGPRRAPPADATPSDACGALFRLRTRHLPGRAIGVQQHARGRLRDEHRVARLLEQRPVALLARPQLLLPLAAFGDVPHHAEEPDGPVGLGVGARPDLDREAGPVGADELHLHRPQRAAPRGRLPRLRVPRRVRAAPSSAGRLAQLLEPVPRHRDHARRSRRAAARSTASAMNIPSRDSVKSAWYFRSPARSASSARAFSSTTLRRSRAERTAAGRRVSRSFST